MKPSGLSALLVLAALSGTPAWAADVASVKGVVVSAADQQTEVRIQLSTPSSSYSIFQASNPDRLMVDITGAKLGQVPTVTPGGLVSRAELSTFQDGAQNVRVTLYLSGKVQHQVRVEGSFIVVSLQAGELVDPLAEMEAAPAETAATTPPAEAAPAAPPEAVAATEPPPAPAEAAPAAPPEAVAATEPAPAEAAPAEAVPAEAAPAEAAPAEAAPPETVAAAPTPPAGKSSKSSKSKSAAPASSEPVAAASPPPPEDLPADVFVASPPPAETAPPPPVDTTDDFAMNPESTPSSSPADAPAAGGAKKSSSSSSKKSKSGTAASEPAQPAEPAAAPASEPVPVAEESTGAKPVARPSGPQEVANGAVLTSLDFAQKDRSSQVVLGLKNVDPTVSAPREDLIVVDLPGAVMPSSLRREMDTRFFASAVDEVRAYATRNGTRVAIQLRMGTTYSVSRNGNFYTIDIVTPQEILAQRDRALQHAASAAPSTPETNGTGSIGNAANTEALIGPKGQHVDAQSRYGTGAGTSAPDQLGFATPTTGMEGQHFTGRRVSIDLQDADIHTVFRFLADYGDINIVTSDDVKGNVTVRFEDVPWDEALAAILQAKGLGAQQFGNIVRVAPLEVIKAEQQAILDSKENAKKAADLGVYVAPLNYAQADELVDQIEAVLSERGTVQVDARGNQLIVHDMEDNLAQVRELLRHLDKPNRQITIEARFVEANSSFSRSLGIQWGSNLDASSATGYPTGAFFPNSIGVGGGVAGSMTGVEGLTQNLLVDLGTSATSGVAFSFGSIPGLINLEARLTAAEQEGWGKIISSPRVRVLDNETAKVEQGARIPYLSVSNGGTSVQFVKASLELEVTPHITAEGTIFLDINITNDRPDFGNAVQGQPAIATKQLQTRVLVSDGDTAVLGGVYATTDTYAQGRVPGIGKIPLIGYLFRSSEVKRSQDEMLVFITPRIVPLDEEQSAQQTSTNNL